MSAVRSHSLSIGIVGLPNAGKSTLFNSITENSVPAENFPFCTIDKNMGVVEVPDERLLKLRDHFKAEKTVHSAIKFVDIAGLVKGASKGEGLGNQFLAHIREVDAVIFVLRAFVSETITHVYERIDPLEDFKIVQSELILKDVETVDARLGQAKKRMRAEPDAAIEVELLERVLEHLGREVPVIEMDLDDKEREYLHDMWLLTNKPRIFCLNVREGADDNFRAECKDRLMHFIRPQDHQFIIEIDVKLIGDLMHMDPTEQKEVISMLTGEPTTLDRLIKLSFIRLGLITFYTGSQEEVNAWSIIEGASAKDAAGVIHTDLADSFVAADVINVEQMIECGGLTQSKERGLVKSQSKEYRVVDGDYIIVHTSR